MLLRVCVVVAVLCVVGVCAGGDERWVWRRSARPSRPSGNRKASSIPGYVHPTPPTTASPPITTFRPATSIRGLGRGAPRPRYFPRASANPFFLGPFPPFSLVPINRPRPANDGTTKSRAPIDTAFDGAVLDAGDKYTTLDRLQRERGAPPPLPRPKAHQLGGLHPDEVYYADDDLLIIRGGGFHSDAFQEPSQTLDNEEDLRESPTDISPVVAPLPSPHHEYNGNIPAIVPPPHQTNEHPFSLFVESASDKDYILVPHVIPSANPSSLHGTFTNRIEDDDESEEIGSGRLSTGYIYTPPAHPVSFLTRQPAPHFVLAPYRQAQVQAKPFQSQPKPFQPQSQPNKPFQSQPKPFQSQSQPNKPFQSQPKPFQSQPQPNKPFQSQSQPKPFQSQSQPNKPFQSQPKPFQSQSQPKPFQHTQFQARPFQPHVPGAPFHHTLPLPHSLAGDTAVNYRPPLPSINPEAEVFQPRPQHERYIPGRTRQHGKPRV